MSTPKPSRLMLCLAVLALFVAVSYSAEQVTVQFLYWDPTTDPRYCYTCPSWVQLYYEFLDKNQTVTNVQKDYKQVVFEWVDITSAEGVSLKQQQNVSSPNSLIINGEFKIEGGFNETYIRNAIDAVLNDTALPSEPSNPLMPLLASAFVFGFFETFSPCLIALLSFVLSYTLGETTRPRESMLLVLAFAIGFVIAALFLGLTVGLMFVSLRSLQIALMWGVVAFAVFFGITLLRPLKTPFETKPLVKKLTRKYALTYGGLVLLGFVFYFLDPCIAPVFIAMLPILSPGALSFTLLIFCVGVIVPFLFIGVLAGSISRLVRVTYKNKSKIRAVSGIILIGYALYIVFFYLL